MDEEMSYIQKLRQKISQNTSKVNHIMQKSSKRSSSSDSQKSDEQKGLDFYR